MADLIGQQFGNYRLQRLIGKGGQASVYLGQHLRLLQKQAAIKILHTSVSEQGVATFQQEANTIAALQHPHIVKVLDFDVQQGTPFLVMDYYPAGSLRDRHPRGTRVPLVEVISYVKQVASALQHAHDHRTIHRDVKAANLLVDREGQIVLSDFGIVAIAHSTSSLDKQNFAGTVPYMAPEQIKQHPRRASDQYALAVVIYEWLCGELPFVGTAPEVAIKHLTVAPVSLCQKIPGFSTQVDQVILKALAKEPRDRFPSVREFAVVLEQAAQGLLDASTLKALSPQQQPLLYPATLAQPLPPVIARAQTDPNIAGTTPVVVPQQQMLSTSQVAPVARGAALAVSAGNIPAIDGLDVMRKVRANEIPPNWNVFYSAASKPLFRILQEIIALLCLIAFCILLVVEVFQLPQSAGSHWLSYIIFPAILFLLLAMIFLIRRNFFQAKKDLILVLRPTGMVSGITAVNPGAKSHVLKSVVNYNDVASLQITEQAVQIKLRDKKDSVRLDLTYFASPEDLHRMIRRDYEEFKQFKTLNHHK